MPEGALVTEVPLTVSSYVALVDVEAELADQISYGQYEALVVTSARAQNYVDIALRALAKDAAVYSVGVATTHALHNQGVTTHVESRSRARDLAPLLEKGPVLVLGAREMRDELYRDLVRRSIEVTRLVCYETRPLQLQSRQVDDLREADIVLIGAPSAWSVARPHIEPGTWVVVPGPTTGDVVRVTHERVIEGWDETLRQRLVRLSR